VGGISLFLSLTGSDENAQKYALHPLLSDLHPPQVPICTPLLFSIIFYYLTQKGDSQESPFFFVFCPKSPIFSHFVA
jgi:hypothetical protein